MLPACPGEVSRWLLLTELTKLLLMPRACPVEVLPAPEMQEATNVSLHRARRWHPQKLTVRRFSGERETPPDKPGASSSKFHTSSFRGWDFSFRGWDF